MLTFLFLQVSYVVKIFNGVGYEVHTAVLQVLVWACLFYVLGSSTLVSCVTLFKNIAGSKNSSLHQ